MSLSFLRWSHPLKLLHLTARLPMKVVHQKVERSLMSDQVNLSHVLLQARVGVKFCLAQDAGHCLQLHWLKFTRV